ncbi:hypothetical protein C9E85_16065 [Plesiomonas shigelloides]|uniref:hypothetical protein n=1 Tax=Plesiomonas shigelloides TaxID=703 RepID=UPI000D575B00|nr:hypothetical protein [Plesiomonas shigelloides]PVU64842.1 hypothetical protein C9E85_16065 [Plesiomonas shigelloides]
MKFSDELMFALANWQKGWRENQEERERLSSKLLAAAQGLDRKFKRVSCVCFRKRFLHHGELVDIVLKDKKDEGVVSWTTNKEFAEIFKGLQKSNAVSGAIFEHSPSDDEVVVNICELWKDAEFVAAANQFKERYPNEAIPLFNFRDTQGEVVLTSPLKASEIIALTGASSPFDDLCDQAGIPESQRDDIFTKLVQSGHCPGELKYTSRTSAQRIIKNTIRKIYEKVQAYKAEQIRE